MNKLSCKYLAVYIDKNLNLKDYTQYVTKKLNKFCGLIYKVRQKYPRNCLLMFYNAYAESIMDYGIFSYGVGNKTRTAKVDMAQRRILKTIFFKRNIESLMSTYSGVHILTVYERNILELCHEIFRQMACKNEAILDLKEDPNTHIARKRKKLIPSFYKRTKKKRLFQKNEKIMVYNWLKTLNLIPDNIDSLTKNIPKANAKRISHLYIVDNTDIFEMF